MIKTFELLEIFPAARPYVKNRLRGFKKDAIRKDNAIQDIEINYTGNLRWVLVELWNMWFKIQTKDEARFKMMTLRERVEKQGGKFTPIDTDSIKRQNPKYIIESLGFKFQGNFIKCPFHNEKTASLNVYQKNGLYKWKCHGCNEGGDIIDFIMKVQGVNFKQAINQLS